MNDVRKPEENAMNKQDAEDFNNSLIPEHHDEQTLADGWKKWKRRSGSAQNSTRKMSSIDPLLPMEGAIQQLDPSTIIEEQQRIIASQVNGNNNKIEPPPAQQQITSHWYDYVNPLSYIPTNTFLQTTTLPPSETQSNYSSSTLSHSTTQQPGIVNGIFGWFLPSAKSIDLDESQHDLVTSADLKKTTKDVRKLIQNQDTVWAWYQNHFNFNTSYGEISILKHKTETSPIELPKYPNIHSNNNTENELNDENLGTGEILPDFCENYRNITMKTKIRIATELYYNYPTEKHLYIKPSVKIPVIQYSLVIAITSQPKVKNNLDPNHLNEIISLSVKDWYEQNNVPYEFQLETIALEAGKLASDSLEDLFKLLINWRENFKKIQHVLIVGYKNTVPLTFMLLDILISRNLFGSGIKFGTLSVDGIFPGPYLENQIEQNLVSYVKVDELEKTIYKLVDLYNIKISILGTFNDISVSLALHLKHPNIFRSIYLPKNSYDDGFEKQLFKLLLMSMNLGVSSTRLLLQISKYFNVPNTININDDLIKGFFNNTINNTLSTTSLCHKRPVLRQFINDPILSNDFNLIWTIHAFFDGFKKIKNIDSLENIRTLLKLYKSWDPQTKNLKELKYMLEVLKIDDYSGTIFISH